MDNNNEIKRMYGQFFTITNLFNIDPFHKWLKSVPNYKAIEFLEPFAGGNNIVSMIRDLGYKNEWKCFDIDPVDEEENSTPEFPVVKADTLKNYPSNFQVAITNPPYLAKNSATRRGISFPLSKHDDLYKVALEVMLENTPFVAAIIPESFITSGLFHNRLSAVVSLTCKMFEDTEVPVCLALFIPECNKPDPKDFEIFSENRSIGNFAKLKKYIEGFEGDGLSWKFNDPSGCIGLHAVDGVFKASIRFVAGGTISSDKVKNSSRSVTRIGCPGLSTEQVEIIITEANTILDKRRDKTKDAFMTSFKGLREDGRYRRRLDFAQAREILNLAAKSKGVI